MPELSDAELVEQCLDGGQDAFALLLRRYQDRVYALCLRMSGRPTVAEDLAQESLVRCYQGLAGYLPDRFGPGCAG